MLTTTDLRSLAAARLDDAKILLANARYDGARYLCGYVIEFTLKARICDAIGWQGYPDTRKEFENLQSFKTHNFDTLLHLSGRENFVKPHYFADWSTVNQWNPETRYDVFGTVTLADAQTFLQATRSLMPHL